MNEDLLDSLLAAAGSQPELSSIHTGDTDSSEDEDNRDFENRKYNECGRDIKHLLSASSSTDNILSTKPAAEPKSSSWIQKPQSKPSDTYEPLFGIRVINPVVATNVLEERMVGRTLIPFHRIKNFSKNTGDTDWVVVGVLVCKSATKTSQKGNTFSVWTLSDLKMDLKTISVFLFGRAHTELWKTVTGTVVGILNPSVLDMKTGSKDEAQLSINNHQLVMILGKSKDLGTCKSIKKNGERCTAFVNNSTCEYCVYHIKSEYQKCSKRSVLQSSFSGGGLNALRNKVLGKNQVFYAGKLYTATNSKQQAKDQGRLKVLAGLAAPYMLKPKSRTKKQVAAQLELEAGQRRKDLERLKQLGINSPLNLNNTVQKFEADHSRDVTVTESKSYSMDVIAKLKQSSGEYIRPPSDEKVIENKAASDENLIENKTTKGLIPNRLLGCVPVLQGSSQMTVDLNAPIPKRGTTLAKKKAVAWVQSNGPIKKQDPNNVRGTGKGQKRMLEDVVSDEKKTKIQKNEFFSDRFKKMIAATSAHEYLLEDVENEKQEQYFKRLEMKERMEEKMLSTFKVPCKAVKCLKCKYTSFSATERCKTEKHPLKVFDAMKRFFKCGCCGNRTVSLDVVPTTACKNCGAGKWERTGMMKEHKSGVSAPELSIRGGEQTFINSVVTNTNLDLLVPEKFNQVGGKLLTRGFFQVEKRHSAIYKRMKSMLPRRESERRSHPLSRHCDILSAVETRLSMLSMTYLRYMEGNLCCFIPGKVIDEIDRILSLVDKVKPAPRTHELLQELRDISSMAMEHFDETILPHMKQKVASRSSTSTASVTSSKSTKSLFVHVITDEIQKVKKQTKFNKQQVASFMEHLKNLSSQFKRQTKILREKSSTIKEQERKLQEQAAKLQEQETSIADLKKHVEEWDQKFSDLTAELVRVREDLTQKSSSSPSVETPILNKLSRCNIKPRTGLSKYFEIPQSEFERKRKSTVTGEVPSKISRTFSATIISNDDICNKINENITSNISKNITNSLKNDNEKSADKLKGFISRRGGFVPFLSNSIEFLLKAPISSIKSRKRKMTDDIELK
ncbi:hypothetical protein FQR65_LT15654 [Abscondita terminalis]|nr:hypothetical protein FQR65_LT15654 [Abscondita terminalis]